MNIQHNHSGLVAYPIINKVLLDIYVNKSILGFAGFISPSTVLTTTAKIACSFNKRVGLQIASPFRVLLIIWDRLAIQVFQHIGSIPEMRQTTWHEETSSRQPRWPSESNETGMGVPHISFILRGYVAPCFF